MLDVYAVAGPEWRAVSGGAYWGAIDVSAELVCSVAAGCAVVCVVAGLASIVAAGLLANLALRPIETDQ